MRLFCRAFSATKHEMWISLQILLIITIVFSAIMYVAESFANPDYSYWDALVWTFVKFVDDPADIAEAPVTTIGMIIGTLVGVLGIAIFAVPAGLIGSGFIDAMAEEKREEELSEYNAKLTKAFRPKQCRYTKLRTVPVNLPVTTIQAKQQMDTKDIIDAVEASDCFRLRNLADTQNSSEHPTDRLVVEHFIHTEDCPYGCMIDRQSNITIVSTSSIHEAGIGNFAYYVAEIGGFNFVSKEVEVDKDNPVSFYVVDNPDDVESNTKRFLDDIKRLSPDKKHWTIFLISASGAEEPAYPTHFHFIYGAKKGDEGYDDPNLTITDTESFDMFYSKLASSLHNDYGYDSDRHRYHTGAGKKNIARKIGGGSVTNAFTIRPAYKVTVWDDRHIAIAKTIADEINATLCS